MRLYHILLFRILVLCNKRFQFSSADFLVLRCVDMNILVTGHNGFIGQNLYHTLLDIGHNVEGWDWGSNNQPSHALPAVKDWDLIIHLGAISSTTYTDVDQIMTQNTDFSIWLYEQCQIYGVNLHYASSASVYGTLEHFKEEGPFQPQSPYAYSKYLFDRHVAKYPANNITITGFRYFNVYGHKGEEHKADMASPYTKFIKQAEEKGSITLFENSDRFKRDFVSVEDVVHVHCQLLSNSESGVYNIGTGHPVSFQDVGEAIAQKYQASIDYIPMPEKLARQYQAFTCADLGRLNQLIDMKWTDIRQYIDKNVV